MMKNMRMGSLFKQGTEHLSGLEQTVMKNISACKGLSDIIRTSFGPNGMNKMVVNHLGKLFVTSDCSTIMRELEVEHPAAKLLVLAAQMQEAEVGDGANFTVMFGGELLQKAEDLVRQGLHPADIVSGYQKAAKQTLEYLEEKDMCVANVEAKELFDKTALTKGIYSSVAAKQFGLEDFLSPLIAEACITVMPKNPYNFNVDNVRVVKVLGSAARQSEVIKGMVIPHDTVGSIKKAKDASIAIFTCAIQPPEAETKGTVLLHSAEELTAFRTGEEKEIEKLIKNIAATGATVVATGQTVDDMALHFCEKYKLLVLKITSQHDLRRLARATKSQLLVSMTDVEKEALGFCSDIQVKEIGSTKVTIFTQSDKEASQVSTIVVRAATNNTLNDIERAIGRGVDVVRMMTRDARFLAGAGAVEIELARKLKVFADKTKGLEQYAINAYAQAFEVVPRTLAENAGLTAIDILSSLYSAHEKGKVTMGLDIEEGKIAEMASRGVMDLLITKKSAISLSTDAVITILRVDQIIWAKPAGGPKLPQKTGHWDDD
eukprot:TRINITY_DN8765_c0_g1_i1.p1 TRINITY_DN8765_c0_g1~~TRINITY_DN8765_c0_g1_i1.p1  ORF type:complete len:546 (+),score=158.90 TRINITY_DN8765_c0_g1_i1:82-1719(+)